MPVFRVGSAAFPLSLKVAEKLVQGAQNYALGARPEHVLLGSSGIRATVRLTQPVGPATFVTLSWEGGELTARVPGMATFAAGSVVHFQVDREDHLMFFDDHQGRRMAME